MNDNITDSAAHLPFKDDAIIRDCDGLHLTSIHQPSTPLNDPCTNININPTTAVARYPPIIHFSDSTSFPVVMPVTVR